MAFDTFDTDAVATAGVTFTNANLTAQGGGGFSLISSGIVQALEGKTTGKWYVEFTCVAVSGNVDGIGIVNSWGVGFRFIGDSNINAPGGDVGWGYYSNNHVTHLNAAQTAVNNATWGATDVIGLAIDLDNRRIWWNKNGGAWIGTSGTPDPATNTGGFNINNLLFNSRIYPAVNLSGPNAKFTANFGASAFTGTVPSGFEAGWTNTTAGTYFGTFATSGRGQAVQSPPQNDKSVSKYVANFTGLVGQVVFPYAGGQVNNVKAVIYDDAGSGGLPGALLGVSSNVIATTTHGEQSFHFSGASVTSGSSYWVGMVSDQSPFSFANIMLAPPNVGGVVYNAGPYAIPSNPFGTSPSSGPVRYPAMIYPGVAPVSTGNWFLVFP